MHETDKIVWEVSSQGPDHQLVWTATVKGDHRALMGTHYALTTSYLLCKFKERVRLGLQPRITRPRR